MPSLRQGIELRAGAHWICRQWVPAPDAPANLTGAFTCGKMDPKGGHMAKNRISTSTSTRTITRGKTGVVARPDQPALGHHSPSASATPATPATPAPIRVINRSAICRATGVDMAHISRIFNPKHQNAKPSLDLAIKISRHLGITVEQLCTLIGKGIGQSKDDSAPGGPEAPELIERRESDVSKEGEDRGSGRDSD